jgi:hypothetical protein
MLGTCVLSDVGSLQKEKLTIQQTCQELSGSPLFVLVGILDQLFNQGLEMGK